jgi:hypothetical protein
MPSVSSKQTFQNTFLNIKNPQIAQSQRQIWSLRFSANFFASFNVTFLLYVAKVAESLLLPTNAMTTLSSEY